MGHGRRLVVEVLRTAMKRKGYCAHREGGGQEKESCSATLRVPVSGAIYR
jgi:hypothetical protein